MEIISIMGEEVGVILTKKELKIINALAGQIGLTNDLGALYKEETYSLYDKTLPFNGDKPSMTTKNYIVLINRDEM